MVTLPRSVRWTLIAGTMLVVAWIRLTPAALDGVERAAERRARQTIAERRGAAADDMAGRADATAARAWIAAHPAAFRREVATVAAQLRDELRYQAADGRAYPYLPDYDSYLWLRHARNYLRHGTTCDAVIDGQCRDTLATAPVGAAMRYARSLHIVAIVALHRAISWIAPAYPLPATAFLVPVVVGVLGVLPAFGIGRMLAGDLGGVAAALLVSVNPLFLVRSLGADNDVWNVVLPLCLVWAALRALRAARSVTRVGWALAAATAATLHAATWSGWIFGYAVTLAGLAAAVAVRTLAATPGDRRQARPSAGAAVVVLLTLVAGTGLGLALAGADTPYRELSQRLARTLLTLWRPPAAGAVATTPATWPDVFATVAELTVPSWAALTTSLGGPLLVLTAWLGLLAMLLPLHAWRPWHFLLLIAGNFLYLHLVTSPRLAGRTLVLLLAAPLLVAVALPLTLDRHRDDDDPSRGGRLIVATWFLGALLLAHDTARFVLLLVAPFGVAAGVALGRLAGALHGAAGRLGTRSGRAVAVVLPVALCLTLAPWVRNAHRQMTLRLPEIDDAWWDTLTALRQRTAADTIVFAWWDYGHWIKYVAERRVATDGGNLRTHVPHWLGRALAAPDERESLGLLRMLACGSDATPEPEERAGAFGKLRARGLSSVDAYRLVVDVATHPRDAARARLRAAGLDAAAQEDVLASTHCRPPPARLLVTSDMVYASSWWRLGRWDPTRDPDAAPAAAGTMFFRRRWTPCALDAEGVRYVCPLRDADAAPGGVARAFEYPAGDPAAGRVVVRAADGDTDAALVRAPAVVIAVSDGGRRETTPAIADRLALGALIDVAAARVLLGNPDVLRSTFTALHFLDGRPLTHFVERGRRRTMRGRLVTTWEIVW